MPEIIVYAVEGRTAEQKRALMKDITDSAVRHLGVSAANVVVQVVETPKADKMKGGILFSERTPKLIPESGANAA